MTTIGTSARQEPAPKAPAPGSPGTYRSAAELLDTLSKAAPGRFDMTLAPVANTDEYRVNIVHRPKPASALAHPGNTELHYIIDGGGTIVTGGQLEKAAGADATIRNGVSRHVTRGDVIIIPANTPHWYQQVDGAVTYLEVRFVAPSR
jgi:mannose-6-phosphate isomerase-like protein (cupin superfamily)